MGEALQEDMVTIHVDGHALQAKKGQMLIEVTDAAGIAIPRFCYHPKLSIAANCRMCLVEVEKAPKPLPACATPVADGMTVHTQSPLSKEAQQGTMEFLLINHPLDCPVCDQGGECELQDLSLAYGGSGSRYVEEKRAVPDKDIGALVATEMTRCIHCTRCVRFGDEIAGLREMGGVFRGENVEIGTYVKHSLASELSGNIIDICPVGALTAKPSRFVGRSWEYHQHNAIAAHDGVGSNVAIHTWRGQIVRVVSRQADDINETWISDRDRFAYEGIKSPDRALKPSVKDVGDLDWETALAELQSRLKQQIDKHGADGVGVLVSPNTSLEEGLLIKSWCDHLGISAVDHRLRQLDHRFGKNNADYLPWLGQSIAEVEQNQAFLLVNCNVRLEHPLIGHRVRKAALSGAAVHSIAPEAYDFRFDHQATKVDPASQLAAIAAIAIEAVKDTDIKLPSIAEKLSQNIPDNLDAASIVKSLKAAELSTVFIGSEVIAAEELSLYEQLVHIIATATDSALGYLPMGANTLGLSMIGLPGAVTAADMIKEPKKTYVLWNVEPDLDLPHGDAAKQVIADAELVVAVSSFADEKLRSYADIILPISAFGEYAGTYVNLAGQAQSFNAAQLPTGEARPGWRLAKVIGNLFDANKDEQVLDLSVVQDQAYEALQKRGPIATVIDLAEYATSEVTANDGLTLVGQVGIYQTDGTVRRSLPLQQTVLAQTSVAQLEPETMIQYNLAEGASITLSSTEGSSDFVVKANSALSSGIISIQKGTPLSAALGLATTVQVKGA